MDRLVSLLLSWSLGMLTRGGRFFLIVYLLAAAIFVVVDPWSVGTWFILVVAGLMVILFRARMTRWKQMWDGHMQPDHRRVPPKGDADV